MHYFKDREDAARFVAARLRRLQRNWQSIITIKQEKSGDYSVQIVTEPLSDAIPMEAYSNGVDVT